MNSFSRYLCMKRTGPKATLSDLQLTPKRSRPKSSTTGESSEDETEPPVAVGSHGDEMISEPQVIYNVPVANRFAKLPIPVPVPSTPRTPAPTKNYKPPPFHIFELSDIVKAIIPNQIDYVAQYSNKCVNVYFNPRNEHLILNALLRSFSTLTLRITWNTRSSFFMVSMMWRSKKCTWTSQNTVWPPIISPNSQSNPQDLPTKEPM